jgi:hypothetical protein
MNARGFNTQFQTTYSLDIVGVLGMPAAYVGFIASSGGAAVEKDVLNWQFTGGQPPPATVQLDTITGTAGIDQITLKQDTDHQHIDWVLNGATVPINQLLINDPNGLTINGLGGADQITLDYSNGNPLPNLMHLNSLPLAGGTFQINGLQGTDPLTGTTVDLGKSKVFLAYGGPVANPIGNVVNWLTKGYNGGLWNGTVDAINSSAAAVSNGYQIGYADSADGIVPGQPANTVELMYTLGGDLNLQGTVVFSDFAVVVANFGKPAVWDTGAVTYDSTVSFADFALTVSNFGKQADLSGVAAASSAASASTTNSANSGLAQNSSSGTLSTSSSSNTSAFKAKPKKSAPKHH